MIIRQGDIFEQHPVFFFISNVFISVTNALHTWTDMEDSVREQYLLQKLVSFHIIYIYLIKSGRFLGSLKWNCQISSLLYLSINNLKINVKKKYWFTDIKNYGIPTRYLLLWITLVKILFLLIKLLDIIHIYITFLVISVIQTGNIGILKLPTSNAVFRCLGKREYHTPHTPC